MSFHQKLEFIQYNACLAITGAIRGTSQEKICRELGLKPIYNNISLSRHEQVCLIRLRFERYFSHHRAT